MSSSPGLAPASAARTRLPDLLRIVRDEPNMAPRVVLFLWVAILARLRARRAVSRGDYSTWLRDESSRAVPGAPFMITEIRCCPDHTELP